MLRIWSLISIALAIVGVVFFTSGQGDRLNPAAKLAGRSELVFDWSRSHCPPLITPDAPARAFRDSQGRTQLILSRFSNGRMIGSDLSRLSVSCDPVMHSTFAPDPSQFADKEWITATYTRDGRTIYALVHDEFHGWEHPGWCAKQTDQLVEKCWYNAVTLAISTDGGRSYSRDDLHSDLVASVPYRYVRNHGPMGIFQPSNIVYRRSNGFYYTLVNVQEYKAQRGGVCVMRTRRLDDPGSWRAWDGDSFSVRFIDPYRAQDGSPDSHVCKVVGHNEISDMTQSLTYNTYFDRYLLVGMAGKVSRLTRKLTWGFYFSLSKDLIHWTDRRLITAAEFPQSFRCGDDNPIAHPSILDPTSRSRNYETSGRHAYLFFTRFNYRHCRPSADFDLLRIPIEFSK